MFEVNICTIYIAFYILSFIYHFTYVYRYVIDMFMYIDIIILKTFYNNIMLYLIGVSMLWFENNFGRIYCNTGQK